MVGGYSALHHACLEGNADIVNLLAKAGANLNIKADNISGETALHICCKLDRRMCGKILIDHGALIDARDNFGNNPVNRIYIYISNFSSIIICFILFKFIFTF